MSLNYVKNAGKILCIGRNYAAHVKELNNTAPKQPFFFLKPSSSILKPNDGPVLVPKGVDVHHEVELGIVLGKTLKNLSSDFTPQEALAAIDGYFLSIDMTARNVQDEAKRKGLPWSIGKGFDTFLPVSEFIPAEKIPDPYNVQLYLKINGETKQDDLTNLMVFPINKILSYMSCIMTLEKGDMILTGTPKGVGSIKDGDHIEAGLVVGGEEVEKIDVKVEDKPGPYEFRET